VNATEQAAMPTLRELGDVEALVYVAFEGVDQLEQRIKKAVDGAQGATAEQCWQLHYVAHYCKSWGESIVREAEQLQTHAHDLGLHAIDRGIVSDPWAGDDDQVEATTKALERVVARRREEA
jgi:hypothetical protein